MQSIIFGAPLPQEPSSEASRSLASELCNLARAYEWCAPPRPLEAIVLYTRAQARDALPPDKPLQEAYLRDCILLRW